jgi:iron complex outermembrane recepter protein
MYNIKLVQPFGEAPEAHRLLQLLRPRRRSTTRTCRSTSSIVAASDWDNYFPNWRAPWRGPGLRTGGFAVPICDDAYWNAAGLREDKLGYLALDLPVGERSRSASTGYMHQNEGQGLWGTPYVPTPMGAPLTVRTTEYDIDRQGGSPRDLDARRARTQRRRLVENQRLQPGAPLLSRRTASRADAGLHAVPAQSAADAVGVRFETDTCQFHVQDTWQVSDALRLNFGFKSMKVENTARTIDRRQQVRTIDVSEELPAADRLHWALSTRTRCSARPRRTPAPSSERQHGASPFSTRRGLRRDPRHARPGDLDHLRTRLALPRRRQFEGSLAAYTSSSTTACSRSSRAPESSATPRCWPTSAASTTMGLEAALGWRPDANLTWFNSFAWNDSSTTTTSSTTASLVPVPASRCRRAGDHVQDSSWPTTRVRSSRVSTAATSTSASTPT